MLPYSKVIPYSALYIDMTYSHLAKTLWNFFNPSDKQQFQKIIEKACLSDPTTEKLLVNACVRSSTDLLFQALEWAPGSEVIMTCVNIPHMAQVIRYNGMVVIPVEVHAETLGVKLEDVKKVVSPRTKAIMISYIYGAKFDATDIIDWCHENGILVIEDQAESFQDPSLKIYKNVDVAMFSFGTIKTCSAFGGAITIIKNNEVLYRKMLAIQDTYPEFTKTLQPIDFMKILLLSYFKRLIKNLVPMLLLNNPTANHLFRWFCINFVPFDYKEMVVQSIRGFAVKPNFLDTFRIQVPTPVMAMLALRLSTFDRKSFSDATRRQLSGQKFLVSKGVMVPGNKVENRSFWLYPIIVPNPRLTYKMLNKRGVDAYIGVTQLDIVESPIGSSYEYPSKTLDYFKNMIYLPINQKVPADQIQKICREVVDVVDTIEKMQKNKPKPKI